MKYLFVKLFATLLAFLIFIPLIVAIVNSGGSAMWALFLGVPFVLGMSLLYRYIDKKERAERSSKKTTAESVASLKTNEHSHPEPYCVSRFIWVNAICFADQCGFTFSVVELSYLWTFFFYVVVKKFRDQAFADSIRHYFVDPLFHIKKGLIKDFPTVNAMQSSYHQLRVLLNNSKINPQAREGIDALWYIVTQWVFGNRECPVDAKSWFIGSSNMIIRYCQKKRDNSSPAPATRYSVDDSAAVILPEDELGGRL